MPKTLNDIIPPSRRKTVGDVRPPQPSAPLPPSRPEEPPRALIRRRFPYLYVIIALVVVALSVGSLFVFSTSTVIVTPNTFSGPLAVSFTATPSVGELPYEIISVAKIASESVPAETTENANDTARGVITAANTEDQVQRFVKNTRFESTSGLIFKAEGPIVIPAGGSVDVPVYAEAPGDSYNIGPTTFTLPGLAGSELGKKVTGRSVAAMTGGFSGERPSVTSTTREKHYAALQETLVPELEAALAAEVKEEYVLLPGAYSLTFSPETDVIEGAGTLSLREKGTATAVIFPNAALARAVAREMNASYQGEEVRLTDPRLITLAPDEDIPVSDADPFSFSLSGTANLLWVVDPTEIASTLAGKSRDAAGTLLLGLPEVGESRLLVRPFWTRSFPNDPKKIQVELGETR